MSLPQLGYFGIEPVQQRVVIDRNRVTGAGVTSGIDFALTLMAEIFGEERARLVQLSMEYDPRPPFVGGSPDNTDPELVRRVRNFSADFVKQREQVARQAAAALKG
jgi:cyclohexyl-isocyanide hydratase